MRRKTCTVHIGDLPLGSGYPIRLQSMTNTDTMDTEATVAQSIRIIEAGGEYVRITAPGVREAEQLAVIKKELHRRGYRNPLIADIHFNPKAAETAARIVEKVRINPGNYADKKSPKVYTDSEYASELERIHCRLLPLIKVCTEYGTAIRIGSNHGSLSDRIVNRYGDSPQGMVESAMEYLRIFEAENFKQVVLSMKASNVRVVIESTRLLVERMARENMFYPLHLGVTEAGEGEDGRIKSAVGMGALLMEGIGDTIRVSLTEAPEAEIPVARKIRGSLSPRPPLPNGEGEARFSQTVEKPHECHAAHGGPVWIKDDHPQEFRLIDLNHFPSPHQSGDFKDIHSETDISVIFKKTYPDDSAEDIYVRAAIDFGPLFLAGLGDGLWIETPNLVPSGDQKDPATDIALTILQACRLRMSKPEYISCPSCGRTLFDLQRTAAKIRQRTSHLKGLKIGIMGCIVNGPGEMADADYGYVGAGPGKITLYRQQEVVKRNIPEEQAVEELISLIKANGDWKE
jgi:(E)-4-hydroxy-3-methylbut-2-enyl-diphosphate synthase